MTPETHRPSPDAGAAGHRPPRPPDALGSADLTGPPGGWNADAEPVNRRVRTGAGGTVPAGPSVGPKGKVGTERRSQPDPAGFLRLQILVCRPGSLRRQEKKEKRRDTLWLG